MYNPFIDPIYQLLPKDQGSLLAGILFGTKVALSKEFYNQLIATGTVHIVALSGQNITILSSFISQLTIFLGRKISILFTILGVTIFILFVGISASLIRAAIMAYLSLMAIYWGRKVWGFWSLILSGVVMLILVPRWAFDISFQLSFLATMGIILFCPRLPADNKTGMIAQIKSELWANLQTTLAAQLFTLPVIFFNFHQISIIAPVTNTLIGWTITPIMLLGFSMSLISMLSLRLGYIAAIPLSLLLQYLITAVSLTAGIPVGLISFK